MTYDELKLRKSHDYISYSDLLGCREWIEFRDKVKERDNDTCKKCNSKGSLGPMLSNGNKIYFEPRSNNEYSGDNKDTPIKTLSEEDAVKLEVHHKRYIKNKLPWEYNFEDLITVCSDCHKEIHEKTEIFVYDESGNYKINTNPCARCGGSGYLPQYDYFEGGICFKCRGIGRMIPFKIV